MLVAWDALLAQAKVNRDSIHLGTNEAWWLAVLAQAMANRDIVAALATLVRRWRWPAIPT